MTFIFFCHKIVKYLTINCLTKGGFYMNPNDDYKPNAAVMNFMQVDRLHHTCVDVSVGAMGFGIHRSQHGMLMFLSRQGENLSQKEIAKFFKISPAAVASSLKALEAAGYIERETDKSDTRKNKVRITDRGREVVSKSSEIFANIDSLMTLGLTENDLAVFRKCLDTMAENLQNEIKRQEENR